jgi:hypothetical protein
LNIIKMAYGILMAIVLLLLNACGKSIHVKPPTVTPTNVIMYDCFRSIQVAAWQDLDGDGLWGVAEPPLEGVELDLNGGFAEVTGSPGFSKTDGKLDIQVWTPGKCDKETYTITANPPESYTPTTPISITFSLNSDESVYKAQFGFRVVSK